MTQINKPEPPGPAAVKIVSLQAADVAGLKQQRGRLKDQAALNELRVVQPFTKWAGTKRSVLKQLVPLVPEKFTSYFEPFAGSGAVYFAVGYRASGTCYLNDCNAELMNTYVQLRDNLEELKKRLRTYVYDRDFYLEVRARDRDPNFMLSDPIDRACRLLYLMRVCYNGLYRVNSKNYFNVPFGRYENPEICNDALLDAASAYLNLTRTKIFCRDYRELRAHMRPGCFVYLDPPYMPVSSTSKFTSYQDRAFGQEQQEELAAFCHELHQAGIRFMLSNSNCDFIRNLYQDFNIHVISVNRRINRDPSRRSGQTELAVTNYEL